MIKENNKELKRKKSKKGKKMLKIKLGNERTKQTTIYKVK